MTIVIPTTTSKNFTFDDEIEPYCCNFSQIVLVKGCISWIRVLLLFFDKMALAASFREKHLLQKRNA